MNIIPPKEEVEMERAISFLVRHINKYCRNKKPLILHSLRVGFRAKVVGLSQEAALAGFLHDLVEDTCCELNEIKEKFGPEVAKLVKTLTSPKIADYKLRWLRLLAQIKKAGQEAMILKAIDVNDNLPWLKLMEKKIMLEQGVFWKLDFVLRSLRPDIGNSKAFKDLEKTAIKVKKWFNKK